jgi:hypothetical protein
MNICLLVTSTKQVVPSKLALSNHFPDFENFAANIAPFLFVNENGLFKERFLLNVACETNRVRPFLSKYARRHRKMQKQEAFHPDSNLVT